MKYLLLKIIGFYRKFISPTFPPSCRFYPTCSAYAYEAVLEHGAIGGVFLAFKRVLKCNPYHKGGYDPVPEKK